MMDAIATLRKLGVQVTPQRIAVTECVLTSDRHPTADEIWECVKQNQPTVSLATVYNVLNLFVEKKLLKTQILTGGRVVFDPNMNDHHHFIDEKTGRIYDIPWGALNITGKKSLKGFVVRDYQVVLRGRKNGR